MENYWNDISATQIVFAALVALLIVQRLLELRLSRRNEAWMRERGGREHAPEHFPFMKIVHTLWFFAMLAEVFFLQRAFYWPLAAIALLGTVAGQMLRYAAITTLGRRWSVRIMTTPESPAVDGGIYRYVRHPNYAGVVLEIASVPLLHGAWLTAGLFTILNAVVLWIRIRAEERALVAENQYSERLSDRPRFVGFASRRDEVRRNAESES